MNERLDLTMNGLEEKATMWNLCGGSGANEKIMGICSWQLFITQVTLMTSNLYNENLNAKVITYCSSLREHEAKNYFVLSGSIQILIRLVFVPSPSNLRWGCRRCFCLLFCTPFFASAPTLQVVHHSVVHYNDLHSLCMFSTPPAQRRNMEL